MSTYKLDKKCLAYIVGVALGDGNLSNPNGRAVRFRITCDVNYPAIIEHISDSIQKVLPNNKVSKIKKKGVCFDISCYSNKWEELLGWKAKAGSKYKQKVSVPDWIKNSKTYSKYCLKGLFETDGSIYMDRGYKMANFVTIIPTLASDVMGMIIRFEFTPNMQTRKNETGKIKHTIRISKNTDKFLQIIRIDKS